MGIAFVVTGLDAQVIGCVCSKAACGKCGACLESSGSKRSGCVICSKVDIVTSNASSYFAITRVGVIGRGIPGKVGACVVIPVVCGKWS